MTSFRPVRMKFWKVYEHLKWFQSNASCTFKREGTEVKTKHLILTFERHTLPVLVKAGYLNCRVRPYVPNPQRCFRCQRFGHGSRSCRRKETCAKCGSHDHVADICENEVCCANCKGPHPAYSLMRCAGALHRTWNLGPPSFHWKTWWALLRPQT